MQGHLSCKVCGKGGFCGKVVVLVVFLRRWFLLVHIFVSYVGVTNSQNTSFTAGIGDRTGGSHWTAIQKWAETDVFKHVCLMWFCYFVAPALFLELSWSYSLGARHYGGNSGSVVCVGCAFCWRSLS